MTCRHAHLDGSYVLGALSLEERNEFEQHLGDCAECARSVRELAGLPGLLARVSPEVLTDQRVEEPLPDTLLPALLQQANRSRRRRAFLAAGVAAAAVTALLLVATHAFDADDASAPAAAPSGATSAPPPGQAMEPVGATSVHASVALQGADWGTRLDLTCTYAPVRGEYEVPTAGRYALFVRTSAGAGEQVATWRALPGRTMQLTAATAARPEDIVAIVVRAANGTPVLRLTA